MENQEIHSTKGKEFDIIKSQSIGRDLELSPPNETENIINEEARNYQKEVANKIILLDKDSSKQFKIFNSLLSLHEKYPKLDLDNFVNTYLVNNGLATSPMIETTKKMVVKLKQHISKPDSVKIVDSFEEKDLKHLEPKRKKMILALSLVGINYKKQPTMSVLAQDYKNVIVDKLKAVDSLDWENLSNNIENVVDTSSKVTSGITSVIQNFQSVQDQFSNRPDVTITKPPVQTAQVQPVYTQGLQKISGENTKYFIIGSAAILGVIVLLVILFRK